MKLNVSFNNATVYGFETLEVVVGEKFKIFVDEFQEGTQWFHNNDSVIDLKTYNGEAMFTAIELGESTVLFVLNGAITRQFVIKVIDVVSLTPKVEEVVYKNFDTEPFVNTVV
jgi:hypothetical protein